METINPKNFIDIDPYTVSFITLKDGNMIMIDELTPSKPNKVKIILEEEKNKNKEKVQELSLSEQINFSFFGNQKNNKNNFNLISKNISFSFLKNNYNIFKLNENTSNNNQNNFLNNFTNPNSSIDIKTSMIQNRKNNYMNINNINNNILSDDNVNIHFNDNIMSPIIKNRKKSDESMPTNILLNNLNENNIYNKNTNLNQINRIIIDTQKYTFDENANKENNNENIFNVDNFNNNSYNNMKSENINKDQKEIINNNFNQINFNNTNGSLNNFNYVNNQKEKIEKSYNKNNIFYSQNNFPRNYMTIQNKNNKSEIFMNNATKENRSMSNQYNRVNRLRQKRKDNNYVKAVVSINIPAEEEESIDLEKQFNSLVDRLNGQKSKAKAKEIIKRSDKYYELYKKSNENIFSTLIGRPEKSKKKYKNKNFFDTNNFSKKIRSKKKYEIILRNNNDISNFCNSKNNNLNSRIMALKERSYTSMNNSFINDNIKENFINSTSNFSEIVLPSNFI